jgi:pyrimidine deaminase RibD-like protein
MSTKITTNTLDTSTEEPTLTTTTTNSTINDIKDTNTNSLSSSTICTAGHRLLMEMAIKQAHLSIPVESAYCVGCVIVQSNSAESIDQDKTITVTPMATGFSRELPGNTHAEECALMKLKMDEQSAFGCDMYTTMEPCSKRLSGKEPCVKHIINAKVGRVFIGTREPDHFVKCKG